MALVKISCSSCKAEFEIDREDGAKLLWECSQCGARNVHGKGLGHAATDAEDSKAFGPALQAPPGTTVIEDSDEGAAEDQKA